MTFNPLTAPLHRTPAGHVGRDLAEQAERDAMRLEILKERETADKAELEQEITRRITERRDTGNLPPDDLAGETHDGLKTGLQVEASAQEGN